MEQFINQLDHNKFRRTNATWNKLRLNDPWSIGYISMLIEQRPFESKEDWEDYYYEMGAVRNRKMESLSPSNRHILNNELMIKYEEQRVDRLSPTFKNINFYHGRTREELTKKAKLLHRNLGQDNPQISIDECIAAVRYRVICESWNGIILRERNTIHYLRSHFPHFLFLRTEAVFDHRYGVDYECYYGKKLLCGIQIKPRSYQQSTPYLEKAKKAMAAKNKRYLEKSGKSVITIIASHKGLHHEAETLREFDKLVIT